MEFPAFHYSANGKDFYLGLVPAKSLVTNYDIDAHSQRNEAGYQRQGKVVRSRRFASFISKHGGFFHQTVLANVRDPRQLIFSPIGQGNEGVLTTNGKLFIVDGQHRVVGIKELLDGEDGSKFSDFPVPVLIMVGAQQKEEAFHFFIVNRTQQGVKAELGDMLLSKVIEKKRLTPEFETDVLGSSEKIPLIQQAVELSQELNGNPNSLWKGKISYPQEPVNENTSITQRGFTQSLKDMLRDKVIESVFENRPDDLVDPLVDYWNAIGEICPEATGKNFKDYVLMKTTGAYIMHKLFPTIVTKCGPSLHQPRMKQILGQIEELNDEDWKTDGDIGTGAGFKLYDKWVKKFIKEVQQKD